MTKPERVDVCRYFYILSDVINTVIFVFALLIFIGSINEDANATLGNIFINTIKTMTIEEVRANTKTLFIIGSVSYVLADVVGFVCRYTLKHHSHRFWPHLVYILPSYILLIECINIVICSTVSMLTILIGFNFVFALVCAIFGMIVHND